MLLLEQKDMSSKHSWVPLEPYSLEYIHQNFSNCSLSFLTYWKRIQLRSLSLKQIT